MAPKTGGEPENRHVDPFRHGVQKLRADLSICPAAANRYVKRMIRVRKPLQGCARAKRFAKRLNLFHAGQSIARPLQKEHGNMDIEKMLATLLRRLAGRMQRKSEECQAAHIWERRQSLRLRCHPAAKGFAAGDKRHVGHHPRRLGHGGAHGRMGELGRVWPPASLFHVGKLITQSCDTALSKPACDVRHKRMHHPRARAMRKHETRLRIRWRFQETGDRVCVIERYRDRL